MNLIKISESEASKLGRYSTGDTLQRIIIVPYSLECGAIEINGGDGLKFTLFDGASNLNKLDNLLPITIELGVISSSTGWKVSVGRGLEVIAIGEF